MTKPTGTMLLWILLALATCGVAFGQQPFTVVSSEPAPADSSVALQSTVRFTFSAPLDTTHRFAHGLPVAFFAPPATPDSVYYSTDLTTMYLDVSHDVDTDYVWIVTGAYDRDGWMLCQPYVLAYTTAPGHGRGTVYGSASVLFLTKNASCHPALVPALLDRPSPASVPVAATAVAGGGGAFELTRVRPGTYWPVLFYDFNHDGQLDAADAAEYAFYHLDYDGVPDSVVVADTSRIDVGDLTIYGGGAAERNAELPGTAHLLPNYPNPFNPQTTLAFSLERPARLRLTVHDVLGREVATLADGHFSTGRHTFAWHAGALPSGVYVARLDGGAFVLTRKVMLLK